MMEEKRMNEKVGEEEITFESIPNYLVEEYESESFKFTLVIVAIYAIICFITPFLTFMYPAAKADLGYGFYEIITIYGKSLFGQDGYEGTDVYQYTAEDGFSPIIKPFIIIGVIWGVIGLSLTGEMGRMTTKKRTIIHLISKGLLLCTSIMGVIAMSKFIQFINKIDMGYDIYQYTITHYLLMVEFIGGILYVIGFGLRKDIKHVVKKEYLPVTRAKYQQLKNRAERRKEEREKEIGEKEKEGGKKEEEKIEERGKEKKLILKRKEK
jgi:hypothetical protein